MGQAGFPEGKAAETVHLNVCSFKIFQGPCLSGAFRGRERVNVPSFSGVCVKDIADRNIIVSHKDVCLPESNLQNQKLVQFPNVLQPRPSVHLPSRAGGGGQPPGERHQDAVVRSDRVRPAHDPRARRQLQGERRLPGSSPMEVPRS